MLLNKLGNVPEVEPDEFDKAAIRKLDQAQKSGEVHNWIKLEELQKKSKNANGRIALRLPKDLHRKAVICADDQGVSLNQYLQYIIASEVAKDYSEFEKEFA